MKSQLDFVMELKNVRRGRISEYVAKFPGAVYTEADASLDQCQRRPSFSGRSTRHIPAEAERHRKTSPVSFFFSSVGGERVSPPFHSPSGEKV